METRAAQITQATLSVSIYVIFSVTSQNKYEAII